MMLTLSPYLHALAARASLLVPVVAAALLVGEWIARGPCTAALAAGGRAVQFFGRKLDRENRGIATLVYRGIIAVFLLLIPAMLVAGVLSNAVPGVALVSMLLLVAWFGHCFSLWQTAALWRRATKNGLPLELAGQDYLFADSHAVLRYLVTTRMDGFAIGVVGGCVWYMLGGLPLMVAYLTLAAAADAYRPRLAFGWAARSLFALMDLLPTVIARLLLVLAAVFTPRTHPLAALRTGAWRGFAANMLGVSLGGPSPRGAQVWIGTGTARLTPEHLRRTLHLLVAASVLLVVLLASQNLYNLLISLS